MLVGVTRLFPWVLEHDGEHGAAGFKQVGTTRIIGCVKKNSSNSVA